MTLLSASYDLSVMLPSSSRLGCHTFDRDDNAGVNECDSVCLWLPVSGMYGGYFFFSREVSCDLYKVLSHWETSCPRFAGVTIRTSALETVMFAYSFAVTKQVDL